MSRKLTALAGVACLLVSQAASAAMLRYTSEASFSAAMTAGLKIESLETFKNTQTPDPTLALNFVGGATPAVTAQLSGQDSMHNQSLEDPDGGEVGTGNAGRKAKDGKIYWQGGTVDPATFTITFDSAVNAFGFWGSDIGDFSTDCVRDCGAVTNVLGLEFYMGSSLVGTYDTPGSTENGSSEFFGFSAGGVTFNRIVFTNLTVGKGGTVDGQGFDRFMVGDLADVEPPTVPEPGMLGLLGLGLFAMSRARRRS